MGNGRGGCHRPGELSDRLRNAVVLYPHSPDGRVGEDGRRFEKRGGGHSLVETKPRNPAPDAVSGGRDRRKGQKKCHGNCENEFWRERKPSVCCLKCVTACRVDRNYDL